MSTILLVLLGGYAAVKLWFSQPESLIDSPVIFADEEREVTDE